VQQCTIGCAASALGRIEPSDDGESAAPTEERPHETRAGADLVRGLIPKSSRTASLSKPLKPRAQTHVRARACRPVSGPEYIPHPHKPPWYPSEYQLSALRVPLRVTSAQPLECLSSSFECKYSTESAPFEYRFEYPFEYLLEYPFDYPLEYPLEYRLVPLEYPLEFQSSLENRNDRVILNRVRLEHPL
jgi:hypothetical protein